MSKTNCGKEAKQNVYTRIRVQNKVVGIKLETGEVGLIDGKIFKMFLM